MKIQATDDASSVAKVTLNGNTASVHAGGNGSAGSISLRDDGGTRRVLIATGKVDAQPPPPFKDKSAGDIGGGVETYVWKAGAEGLLLDGAAGFLAVGSDHFPGSCFATDGKGTPTVQILGSQGTIRLNSGNSSSRIELNGFTGAVKLKSDEATDRIVFDADIGYGAFGGNKWNGGFGIFPQSARTLTDAAQASIWMSARYDAPAGEEGSVALLKLGGAKKGYDDSWADISGLLVLASRHGGTTITLDGQSGDSSFVGTLRLRHPDDARTTMSADPETATLLVGSGQRPGMIRVRGFGPSADDSHTTIEIDGKAGDIKLLNADCAEDFDVGPDLVVPGMVMVIGANQQLSPSSRAYDKKAAGVISGAGNCRPAITLGKRASDGPRMPLALTGTVYCYVEADSAAIEVGDLLTTSNVVGHAMKATDPLKAFGAVVGKALEPLASGRGLVPILVALQ